MFVHIGLQEFYPLTSQVPRFSTENPSTLKWCRTVVMSNFQCFEVVNPWFPIFFPFKSFQIPSISSLNPAEPLRAALLSSWSSLERPAIQSADHGQNEGENIWKPVKNTPTYPNMINLDDFPLGLYTWSAIRCEFSVSSNPFDQGQQLVRVEIHQLRCQKRRGPEGLASHKPPIEHTHTHIHTNTRKNENKYKQI